ncbi:YCF48-related protein [Sansalvadorimonas sp. 2012CJ34-2]|uniref:YCF48-related protein n=1 Tax=Parendozoicomonas callyspongiae TaxID=2942213 RepID=A0ABT0PLF1_9GAMM|nr:YCF48-related protein [Sansalvadorimonas sp. 2012CJ34-2]MCL6272091.1 YCF48-related protein [Sansalvadorimonas sp. 2012CJ34-2]
MKYPDNWYHSGQNKRTLGLSRFFRKLAPAVCSGMLVVSAYAKPATDQVLSSLMLDIERAGKGDRLVAVGERGHVIWSDDMGNKWSQSRVPVDVMLTSVYFPTEKTGFAVGHDATIFKTVDGGVNWAAVYEDKAAEVPLLDVFFINENTGFAMGAYGYFLQTSDAGKTWNNWADRTSNDEELHLNAMTRLDNGTLLMAGEAGLLLRSIDDGKFWEKLETPYDGSFFGVQSLDQKGTAVAFGLRGNAFMTKDSGLTWKELDTGTEQTLFDGVVLDGDQPLLVGSGGALALKSGADSLVSNLNDRATLTGVIQARDNFYVITSENGVRRVGPGILGQSLSRQ